MQKKEISQQDSDLLEATQANFNNFINLFDLLTTNENLTVDLYNQLKEDYLKYAYEFEITKTALIKKYYNNYQQNPDVSFKVNYHTLEIIFYD